MRNDEVAGEHRGRPLRVVHWTLAACLLAAGGAYAQDRDRVTVKFMPAPVPLAAFETMDVQFERRKSAAASATAHPDKFFDEIDRILASHGIKSNWQYVYPYALYASCLTGAYRSDGSILFGVARAAVENSDWGNASAALARLKADAPKIRPLDVRLLEARVLASRGENDAALAAYRDLVPVFVGLEARYRYGEFLAHLERHEAASHMFDEVIKHSKRFASSIEDEQRWAAAARQAISNH